LKRQPSQKIGEINGREMQVFFVFLLRERHALIAFGACSVIKGIKLFMYKRVKNFKGRVF